MKKTLLYLLLGLIPTGIFAQQATKRSAVNPSEPKRCGTTEKMLELRALDPVAYDKNKEKQEQIIQNWIVTNYNSKAQVVYTIPVVVQIFGSTPGTQVTDNRVNEQIDVLNKDFRRLNTDASQTPSAFQSIAADVEIEFCLATVDPQGNPTTGIIRKTTPSSPSSSDLWNTTQYLNLLVYSIGGGTLGYTYLPSQAPNNGVHIGYQYFGKTGASSPYNKGRTATHEIGHWFNLEHIWADESACNADDNVSDTPQQKDANYGCPSYPQTTQAGGRCNTNDPSSMYMNYLDYTDDACMNMFSAGQKARMISAINNYRTGLLNNGKCGTIAPTPPVADFSANSTNISTGSCVNFSDLSTGLPTTWSWTFQGATPSGSTQQNPSNICYNTTGCYDVTLIVSNADGSDTMFQSCYINVVPSGSLPCDTVSSYASGNTPTLLLSGGTNAWGWVTGHNNYDDRAKADFFTIPPAGFEITGAKFWFAKAHAGNSTSSIDVKIWADNGGTPGAVLYTQTVLISSLLVYPQETYINFTSPQTVTGNYYLGVQFAANGSPQDSIALMSNADGETSPGTAWELWSDGSWYAMSDATSGWNLNLSLAIWALRCPVGAGCNLATSTTEVSPGCGQNNGSITASTSGGTSPYTYLWSNGQTGATATGLTAGNYNVIISDAAGCTDTTYESLQSAGAPTASVVIINVSCFGGSNGSVTVNASGGTLPYSYVWNTGATTNSISGLTAGSYSGTITDANGCQSSGAASVTEPPAITGTTTSTDAGCGLNNGTATVMAGGGTSPYSYQWPNGQTTATATGMGAGNYSVIITDSNLCQTTVTASVSNANGPTATVNQTNATAFGACDGTATAVVSGGITPYFYQWSTGASTQTISGLCAGPYSLSVSDINNCIATESIIITQPVGVNQLLSQDDIRIFPNPNNGKFTIVSNEISTVTIYNVIGEKILTDIKQRTGGRLEIDLSGHDKGLYFVEISAGNKTVIKKVSVIR